MLKRIPERSVIIQTQRMEEQDGAVVRARCHMWVEFVVGSPPCFEGFSLVFRFSSLSKFQFDQEREPASKPANADVASSLNIVIYFMIEISPPVTRNYAQPALRYIVEFYEITDGFSF